LIDSRHSPQKIDLEFCNWLGEKGLSFVLVFTKADKQSGVKTDQNIALFKKAVLETFDEVPAHFITSAETQLGHDDVLSFIDEVNKNFIIPQIQFNQKQKL